MHKIIIIIYLMQCSCNINNENDSVFFFGFVINVTSSCKYNMLLNINRIMILKLL